MSKSSKQPKQPSGRVVSISSVGDAAGVPLDGSVLESETLESAVEAAVVAMDWLTAADQATVELALSYARQIDLAQAAAVTAAEVLRGVEGMDPDEVGPLVKACNEALAASMKAHYLGPHLHAALKSLGGDPVSRLPLDEAKGSEDTAAPVDPLAAMRAAAAKRSAGA